MRDVQQEMEEKKKQNRGTGLTEIGDARTLGFDLRCDAEDWYDGTEGRGDDLVVEDLGGEGGGGGAAGRPPCQALWPRVDG